MSEQKPAESAFIGEADTAAMVEAAKVYAAKVRAVTDKIAPDPGGQTSALASVACQHLWMELMAVDDVELNECALRGLADGLGRQFGIIGDPTLRIVAVNVFGQVLMATVNQTALIHNTQGNG